MPELFYHIASHPTQREPLALAISRSAPKKSTGFPKPGRYNFRK